MTLYTTYVINKFQILEKLIFRGTGCVDSVVAGAGFFLYNNNNIMNFNNSNSSSSNNNNNNNNKC